ncbi:hypothetical protein OESDEN_04490 [Oesophagostomum dentatum]|uniref:Protein CNPPD1 n=1 Tax=Oesophagostomum dentatum TaxID=61180 RepID=A0A0B1TJI8_OESDE|nr:hypothetical protein OESDEN_04490 [Oesophagostomum dentatum]
MAPQFPDFRRVRRRIRRTLCYGAKQPQSINLPLSELVVDFFNKKCPYDYMKPETSASISCRGYADPCTLVVAMVYLDRLRVNDKVWFESSDPTDLYLPALVVASKFLHDSDTFDRASNSDWAEAANISNEHLNQLEWEFVQKMKWDVMVDQAEFERWLSFFEHWVANDFVLKNGFCTYNEILQLSSSLHLMPLLQALISFFGLVTIVYTVSVVSLIAAPCALLSAENSRLENKNTTVLPSTPALHESDDSRILFPDRYELSETSHMETDRTFIEAVEAANDSVVTSLCLADFIALSRNNRDFERIPDCCSDFIGKLTGYSIHPFLGMVC